MGRTVASREICKISLVWQARFGDGLWIPRAQKLTGSPLLPPPPSLWETAIVGTRPFIEDLRLWAVRRFSEIVYHTTDNFQFPVHKTHHHVPTCPNPRTPIAVSLRLTYAFRAFSPIFQGIFHETPS